MTMSRNVRKFGRSAAVLTALCALGLGGCVEERAFYIAQNQLPAGSTAGCTPASGEGTSRPRGLLDVSADLGYTMFPLLKFEIQASEASGVERNNFVLRRFNVDLDMSAVPGSYPSELTSFAWETSGSLRPGSSLATSVKVIPDQLAQLINIPANVPNPTVVAKVQAVAVRLGTDSEIESTTFHYPIELCTGCLVTKLNECPAADDKTTTVTTNACGLPQDTPVTCCPVQGKLTCLSGS